MIITVTDLRSHLGKYLRLAVSEDIFITQRGKIVAKLTGPRQDCVDVARPLFGILPQTMTIEELRAERLKEMEDNL